MSERRKPRDLPRKELMAHAQSAIDFYEKLGMEANVQFKASCPACGARCTFVEVNVLREQMECCVCGVVSPVLAGGYMLMVKGVRA